MNCPKCQAPLQEDVQACPHCGFTLSAIGAAFGPIPQISRPLADLDKKLTGSQRSKIRREIKRFSNQFPQISWTVVVSDLPAEVELPVYSFWLLNKSDICSDLEKGGLNFHMLLVVDAAHKRLHLTIGYGLEPFISQKVLRKILEAGAEPLGDGLFGDAIISIIKEAVERLHEIGGNIPQTYGLPGGTASRDC